MLGDITEENVRSKLITAAIDQLGQLDILVSAVQYLFFIEALGQSSFLDLRLCKTSINLLISNQLIRPNLS